MKKKWGVVQLVGHLTVNEDGEGSNPSAPAKFAVLDSGFFQVKTESRAELAALRILNET
jgi:hypothetical protein